MNFKRDTRFTRELNKVPTLETCGAEAIWTVLASRWDFETSLGGPFDLEMVSQIWNTPPNYLWYAIHACYVRTFSGRNYRLTTNYHLDLSASPHVKKVSGREGNRWQKLPWNGTDDDLPPEGREVHLEERVESICQKAGHARMRISEGDWGEEGGGLEKICPCAPFSSRTELQCSAYKLLWLIAMWLLRLVPSYYKSLPPEWEIFCLA